MLADPDGEARTQVILSQRGRAGRQRDRVRDRARAAASTWDLQLDVVPRSTGEELAPRLGRAALRRRARPRPRLARGLAASRAAAPRGLGSTLSQSFSQSVADLAALRMRSEAPGRRPAARRRDAVVHDRVRPRHAHHVPADAALRAGARTNSARGARRAAGEGGRPVDRRRAGEDRPRGPHRQGGEALVPLVLRHGRRDPALPRPALRGLALDGRPLAGRAGSRTRRCARSSGSTSGATATATASSSTSAAASAGSRTSRGRTRATRSASPTAAFAKTPIAPAEVQGYVYDAKRRIAEIAREVWRDRGARRPARTRRRPSSARSVRRGVLGRPARRLLRARARRRQAAGRLVCSNIGHLLWSGIVPPQRVDAGRRRAHGRRALVGLGRADDVRPATPPTTRSRTTTARSGPTTTP